MAVCILYNIINVLAWCALAYHFGHWWIALFAIVTDGLVADMAVWRGIAKAIETLRKEEREAI